MATRILHGAKSDIGLKRSRNEDCFLADPHLGLYAVCDGMGGGNAGEVASRMAVETIHARLLEVQRELSVAPAGCDSNVSPATNRLAEAVRMANEAILRASWTEPACAGMGTTVVAALLSDDLLSVAHVGDSRLYLIRNGSIEVLTADHSWVAEQVRQGFMTNEEAERSPKRNIVTRALGVDPRVEVEVGEIPVRHGDRFLLCSDGLTRGIRNADILRVVDQSQDVHAAVDHLVAMANHAGGEDNTTVLMLNVRAEVSHRFWERFTNNRPRKAS